MTEPLKIGSTVWYEWTPYQIIGETRRSWLIGYAQKPIKIPKKRRSERPEYFISQREVDDNKFCGEAWRIGEHVRHCQDASTLRQIAALVGYKPKGQA